MDINDYVGYELTCAMSKEYKGESFYNENEFELIISKDSNEESGYKAITIANDSENKNVVEEWDVEDIGKKLLFGNWEIKRKVKI